MTVRRVLAAVLGLAAGATLSLAFTPATRTTLAAPKTRHPLVLLSTPNADCGCGNSAKITGAPSQEARSINPREAILQSRVMRLDGTPEQILQYASKREELLATGVQFILISIGKPEIGLKLCEHLEIENGPEFIFADPENKVYDKLALNRGWDTMIRPATAFRFRDRIFGNGQSLDQLFEVLGKWKDAVYIPPKIEQSTNHGGTFIFNGENVIFAHYDESPGTHADTYEAVTIALQTAKEAKLTPA
ncbi:hypothetical protein ACHAW6_014446 [Cyclotella cf. meneghiniana]